MMQWFYDINIKLKLTIGFLLVALIAAVVGIVGLTNIMKLLKPTRFFMKKIR